MRVLKVAQILSTTPDTVRFYTRTGLLHPAVNSENGYKDYTAGDVSRLKFILAARNLGFSVDDIRSILSRTDENHSACSLVRDLINKRLEETEMRFQEMVELRSRMQAAAKVWNNMDDRAPSNQSICHLIESFTSIKDEPHND
jgi:DNA-binding transcriptional MerR regulator